MSKEELIKDTILTSEVVESVINELDYNYNFKQTIRGLCLTIQDVTQDELSIIQKDKYLNSFKPEKTFTPRIWFTLHDKEGYLKRKAILSQMLIDLNENEK